MVEPVSSSRVALPARAASARRVDLGGAVPEVARLGVADHRDHQPGVGLRRHADMDGAVAVDDAGLVVDSAR